MIIRTVQGGNLEALKFVIKAADIDVPTICPNIIPISLSATSPEILSYLLDMKELDLHANELIRTIRNQIPDKDLIRVLLDHVRLTTIVKANKELFNQLLLEYGYVGMSMYMSKVS